MPSVTGILYSHVPGSCPDTDSAYIFLPYAASREILHTSSQNRTGLSFHNINPKQLIDHLNIK